ncbi:MAG: formyltransferase family protein [Eikenella sp.]|nr:formyltransferase family protein [Eikenella sp.]
MKIAILCDSETHPINPYLQNWIETNQSFNISIHRDPKTLQGGDILFLISCNIIIKQEILDLYTHVLVIHASNLPKGRGWSPHIWQILEGKTNITVSLLEASEKVDTGKIWKKIQCDIPETFLYDEINDRIFKAELELMDYAVMNYANIQPVEQDPKITPSYYPKRQPSDSELDINSSIISQFNKIRVSDPNRYPAFFYINGIKFNLFITKE